MKKRTAFVNELKGISVSDSSILGIGDTKIANPKSRLMAIQKEKDTFTKRDDVPFSHYPIFTMPEVEWLGNRTQTQQEHYHHQPSVHVNHLRFNGADTSSIVQIGSIHQLSAESRVKHFRILESENSNMITPGNVKNHHNEREHPAQGT